MAGASEPATATIGALPPDVLVLPAEAVRTAARLERAIAIGAGFAARPGNTEALPRAAEATGAPFCRAPPRPRR